MGLAVVQPYSWISIEIRYTQDVGNIFRSFLLNILCNIFEFCLMLDSMVRYVTVFPFGLSGSVAQRYRVWLQIRRLRVPITSRWIFLNLFLSAIHQRNFHMCEIIGLCTLKETIYELKFMRFLTELFNNIRRSNRIVLTIPARFCSSYNLCRWVWLLFSHTVEYQFK